MKKLFTERHGGTKPRVAETLDDATRRGLLTLVQARIDEQWFGQAFPYACEDGRGNAGCDTRNLNEIMAAYGVISPADYRHSQKLPSDGQIFDLIEFSYEPIALPEACESHSYWGHSHYRYDKEVGQEKFQDDVNRILERNGLAFNLEHGEVVRIAPSALHEVLAQTTFNTGDTILDELLEVARQKFLNRSLDVRRESLEKLWDAWERLKTVEPGKDKKSRVAALLDKAATEPTFRQRLEDEAVALTQIGNTFMIRHTETDKIPIEDSAHVDYLFHRMFALVGLLLKASGRGG